MVHIKNRMCYVDKQNHFRAGDSGGGRSGNRPVACAAGDLIAALEKSKGKAADAAGRLKKEGEAYADEAAGKAGEYVDSAREQVGNL
jgi:hypothetical protein